MAETILLTGATGFIGSHLLEILLAHGYQVVILKRSFSDTWRIKHLIDQVKSYDLDKELVEKAFDDQKIDIVIHLATYYLKFDSEENYSEMFNANVSFPAKLIENGIQHGIKGFVNTGTFFEYDCSILPVKEDAAIKPFNFYAKTKIAFENILRTYSERFKAVTLRLFSPYGEKDNDKLISIIVQKTLKKETIELSDGIQKLDFIYVRDIVDAYLKVLGLIDIFSREHNVYNIGSGFPISVREVVSILEQQFKHPIRKNWGEPSKTDMPIVFADISKAVKDLKWKPLYSIQDGLAMTVKYYQELVKQ